MSTNDQKLITDHQKVVETIRNYDKINLINTSGEPVDEYDIEYKIKGYTNSSDGRVKISNSHRIKIQLPFGYPHFHPTVKPLSPIFHPDIDDFAIRIAHHWEKNKSLPDLIIHIGNMICAKEFSTENPFNKTAGEYYEKHKLRLPLDNLEQPRKPVESDDDSEPISLDFLVPLFKFILLIIFVASAGFGALYYYEDSKINEISRIFDKATTHAQDQEYQLAQKTAQKALTQFEDYYLLDKRSILLKGRIDNFLNSEPLIEGLRGKIKYGNRYLDKEIVNKLELIKQFEQQAKEYAASGDDKTALEKYDEAIQYAEKNDLEDSLTEIKQNLSDYKLEVLVAASEDAHKSKKWDWAIEKHQEVVDFIKKERQFLKSPDKQLARTSHLLLIDQIALYTKLASEAEKANNIEVALESYNTLITLIGKAKLQDSTTLKNTLVDAMQKSAILTEKLNIQQRQQWLLENFREVFQIQNPNVIPATLRSPQAIFVKYDGKNPVFDLSCIEKSQGTVVRLRVFVQYNPDTGGWSVYDGEIEQSN